eukprot:g5051.t1
MVQFSPFWWLGMSLGIVLAKVHLGTEMHLAPCEYPVDCDAGKLDPSNSCEFWQCINQRCELAEANCDDDNECTEDHCLPHNGNCLSTPTCRNGGRCLAIPSVYLGTLISVTCDCTNTGWTGPLCDEPLPDNMPPDAIKEYGNQEDTGIVCPDGEPYAAELGNCGPLGNDCPEQTHYCYTDPADRFAVCCPKHPHSDIELSPCPGGANPDFTYPGDCSQEGASCKEGFWCLTNPTKNFAVCCPDAVDVSTAISTESPTTSASTTSSTTSTTSSTAATVLADLACPCGPHGACDGDMKCICDKGWTGPLCTVSPCEKEGKRPCIAPLKCRESHKPGGLGFDCLCDVEDENCKKLASQSMQASALQNGAGEEQSLRPMNNMIIVMSCLFLVFAFGVVLCYARRQQQLRQKRVAMAMADAAYSKDENVPSPSFMRVAFRNQQMDPDGPPVGNRSEKIWSRIKKALTS